MAPPNLISNYKGSFLHRGLYLFIENKENLEETRDGGEDEEEYQHKEE